MSSDNAMGSPSGDVDDGFALLHLVARGVRCHSLCSVFGNTGSKQALENTNALLEVFGHPAQMTLGARDRFDTISPYLEAFRLRPTSARVEFVELGPLTNLANLLKDITVAEQKKIASVRIMGTTLRTRGRYPPLWPFEYNLTKDRPATKAVFRSELPLLVFPLDVARRFRLHLSEVALGSESSTAWVKSRAKRWFDRNQRFFFQNSVIAWDVLVAVHLTHPHLFSVEEHRVSVNSWGAVQYGSGKAVNVVVEFDEDQVRAEFLKSLAGLNVTDRIRERGSHELL